MTRHLALVPVLAVLLAPAAAPAQPTSVPPSGPGWTSGPAARFAPAWGYRAYTNEDFAYHPRDFGQCTVGPGLGLVFCGVKSGDVVALSLKTGALAWTFHTRGAVRTQPALAPEGLFVGSSDGCLYRLDPATGKPAWKAPYCTDAAVYGSPVVADGKVFFSVTINKLYAVNVADGTFAWEVHRDRPQFMSAEGVSGPALDGDRLYVGFSDGSLAAIDRAAGRPAWVIDLSQGGRGQTDVDTTPVIDEDRVLAAAFGDGPAAVRKSDGTILWRGKWFGCTRPVLAGDLAIFGTADGEVIGVRRTDGALAWSTRLNDTAAYPPVLVGDVVVAGGEGGLYAFEPRSGWPIELLSAPQGVRTPPAVWGRRLFFTAGGGTVNAVDLLPR